MLLSRPVAPAANAAAQGLPPAAAGGGDAGDAGPPTPIARTDIAASDMHRDLWRFDEAPPRRLGIEGEESMIVEADMSALGLFRLETRPMPGGFAMVIRHVAPLPAARADALAEAVMGEAAASGVRARVRFDFDPALRPSLA